MVLEETLAHGCRPQTQGGKIEQFFILHNRAFLCFLLLLACKRSNPVQITEGDDPLTEECVRQLIKAHAPKPPVTVPSPVPPRFTGKGHQYQADLLVLLEQCLVRIEDGVAVDTGTVDGDAIIQAVAEGKGHIKERLKLIGIADKAGTWKAVDNYLGASDIADDASDAKRIQAKKDKASDAKRTAGFRQAPYYIPRAQQQFGNRMAAPGFFYQQAPRPYFAGTTAPKMASQGGPGWKNRCYGYGEVGHWKPDCPGQQGTSRQ